MSKKLIVVRRKNDTNNNNNNTNNNYQRKEIQIQTKPKNDTNQQPTNIIKSTVEENKNNSNFNLPNKNQSPQTQSKEIEKKEQYTPIKTLRITSSRLMMRGIPPTITEEMFFNVMQPHLTKSDSTYFVQGVSNPLKYKQGRAYFNFDDKKDAEEFKKLQSVPLFKNEQDEFVPNQISDAPFQKVAIKEIKPDQLENTIDEGFFFFIYKIYPFQKNICQFNVIIT